MSVSPSQPAHSSQLSDGSTPRRQPERAAVIVGVGQIRRRPELDGPWDPQEPAALMALAIDGALADAANHGAGAADSLRRDVTGLASVDPIGWGYVDLCGSTANAAKLTSVGRTFTWPPGGNSAGDLLHEVANAIADGGLDIAVLTGSEVVYSLRRARKEGVDLQQRWTPYPGRRDFLKGQRPLTTAVEARHGMVAPIQCYPMYENAIRAAAGRTITEHQRALGALMARNSQVAATNPNAWFPTAWSAEQIASVDAANRMVCFPYPKRMNAIMEVDQAAALVIMSKAEADRRGIAPENQIAFLGGSSCVDAWTPSERANLAASPAIAAAATTALAHAGLGIDEIDAFDLYSCFPSAIQMAMSALGLADNDPRGVTLTGGLAYAGGPGNSYALHSMCVAVENMRRGHGTAALITSLGNTASKHAISILGALSASATADFRAERISVDASELEGPEVVDGVSGDGVVVSYTVEYGRDGTPTRTIYIVLLEDGRRTVGNGPCTDEEIRALTESEGVGRAVRVTAGVPGDHASLGDFQRPGDVGTPNRVVLR
jgi:acetyl-CoA C-acetyltransferase